MTLRRARVLRIDIGIGDAVETHRAVAGRHHAAHDEQYNAGCFRRGHVAETVRRHPHGTERERHREQRMAKANHVTKFKNLLQHSHFDVRGSGFPHGFTIAAQDSAEVAPRCFRIFATTVSTSSSMVAGLL